MDLAYALAKLWRGADVLATSPAPIQDRLRTAWIDSLGFVPFTVFPEGSDLRADWNAVYERVTTGQRDNFAAIAAMSDDEAAEVARQVMSILYWAEVEAKSRRP